MGPSGAGKTSLLNCLSGGNGSFTGQILLNGHPWNNSQKRCTAYVQQDDLFPPELTPTEFLQIVARLRMDHGLTDEERHEAVEGAIQTLGLTKCRETRIGDPGISRGISGGERKRLSIASEILNDPSMIFCDEPTSGLDSFMAESVIQQLRDLASDPIRPRTIIATIHQPSSQTFALFDQLNLITEGRNAYFGPGVDSVEYFEAFGDEFICPPRVNPSDYFLSLLSPQVNAERVETVCQRFQSKQLPPTVALGAGVGGEEAVEEDVIFKSRYPARWYTHVSVLVWRAMLVKSRNPKELQAQFIQIFIFSFLIGGMHLHLSHSNHDSNPDPDSNPEYIRHLLESG